MHNSNVGRILRGYYIYFDNNSINIEKKIDMQMAELRKISDATLIKAGSFLKNEELSKILSRINIIGLPRWNYQSILQKIEDPDYVYIRRTVADRYYMSFLRAIRIHYPRCKIIVELFTYPYLKDDFLKLKNATLFLKECSNIHKYKRYVDRFVTYTSDKSIYGVKTLNTINGIDPEAFPPIHARISDDEIHLIAVAMFQKHHGYERVIDGIYEYRKKGGERVIRMTMVGDGPELTAYKQLVHKYELDECVRFVGIRNGSELELLYNDADIGLGSFGFYKIGLSTASSLKTREYLAKGLPVVAGCKQDVAILNDMYCLEYDNDDSSVDIEVLIDFYQSLLSAVKGDKSELAKRIHSFAADNFSMKSTFKCINDYIISNDSVSL